MKYVKTFESFTSAYESANKIEIVRKKLEGKAGKKTIMSIYNFYIEKGYKDIKDPKKLLSKIEYFDQKIRDDKIFYLAQDIGISPVLVDQTNAKLVEPYIGKVKPGTDEFSKVWLVVQHADHNVQLQKKFLEIYGDEMKKTDSSKLAFMSDRIAANEGKPQKGISQGMEITLGSKTGWLPYQNADIDFEPKEIKAKDAASGKEVALLKWKEGETTKVNDAVKATVGEKGIKQAKDSGIEVNLKNYIVYQMDSAYLGPYMIKR